MFCLPTQHDLDSVPTWDGRMRRQQMGAVSSAFGKHDHASRDGGGLEGNATNKTATRPYVFSCAIDQADGVFSSYWPFVHCMENAFTDSK